MDSQPSLSQLLEQGFIVYVTRFSDEPIDIEHDQVLFTDPRTGRSLVARHPLELPKVPAA